MQATEKWATRSDAWTPEDDTRLAEIVLHHIRIGSTQLRAFEESANELGRTSAACGYRWNGVVRKNHRDDIEQAKQERKNAQRSQHAVISTSNSADTLPTTMTSSDSMKEVIKFLETYDEQYQKLRKQVETLDAERRALVDKVRELESKVTLPSPVSSDPVTPQQLEEDSKALFAIMERARKLLESDATRARAVE
ncbi:MAG: transcriptional regulator [Alicyclobacillus sp. RIFOXYA1_FULL_53_8]|nr:MAG: transcriptional regulator [Alicyclobacillus sp. RIFOXYA1_FULL_53_8]